MSQKKQRLGQGEGVNGCRRGEEMGAEMALNGATENRMVARAGRQGRNMERAA